MSLISTFFLAPHGAEAPPENARSSEKFEIADLTDVEVGLVWEVLSGEDWDDVRLEDLEPMEVEHDSVLYTLPEDLVEMLAGIEDGEISEHVSTLMEHEEFEIWDAEDVGNLLVGLRKIAIQSLEEEKIILFEVN